MLAELEDARPLLCHEFMDFRAKQERIRAEADAITVDPAGLVGGVQVELRRRWCGRPHTRRSSRHGHHHLEREGGFCV